MGQIGTVTECYVSLGMPVYAADYGDGQHYSTRGISEPIMERIPMLDPTKPLRFCDGTLAVFITGTSEGHILVTDPCSPRGLIFTRAGEFVRSSDGSGSALTLHNDPVTVTRYLTFFEGHCSDPLRDAPPIPDYRAPVIKLTITDGIVTAAELHAPNKEPINVA